VGIARLAGPLPAPLPLDFSPANLSESYTISEREISKLESILHSFKSPSRVDRTNIKKIGKMNNKKPSGESLRYRERERERERESPETL